MEYQSTLQKRSESEVSIPNLSEQIDADGVLSLINTVEIVSMRQKTPPLSISEQEEENYRRKIKGDIDVVLCEKMPEAFRDIIAEIKVKDCMENLKREANRSQELKAKEWWTYLFSIMQEMIF